MTGMNSTACPWAEMSERSLNDSKTMHFWPWIVKGKMYLRSNQSVYITAVSLPKSNEVFWPRTHFGFTDKESEMHSFSDTYSISVGYF